MHFYSLNFVQQSSLLTFLSIPINLVANFFGYQSHKKSGGSQGENSKDTKRM